jgi:hypothetical protein
VEGGRILCEWDNHGADAFADEKLLGRYAQLKSGLYGA